MDNTREKLIELLDQTVAECMPSECIDEIADHLIANGVTIRKWIPVTERLPDEDGTYIVRTTSGAVTTARFYKKMTFPPTAYRNEEYVRKASFQSNRHVTHWMPLPEPPKGE